MFYISALLAIMGAAGYQFFVKRIPPGINPVVSVIGIYAAVLVLLGALLLKEEISFLNAAGILISIIGVAMISYRG